MPASEIVVWEQYFQIYPFREYREDERNAQLCQVIVNMGGKAVKHPVKMDMFMPEYWKDSEKSLMEQTRNALAFRERLKEVKGQ